MPTIRRNYSFISYRRIIDEIENFFEVFVGTLADHVVPFSSQFGGPGNTASMVVPTKLYAMLKSFVVERVPVIVIALNFEHRLFIPVLIIVPNVYEQHV